MCELDKIGHFNLKTLSKKWWFNWNIEVSRLKYWMINWTHGKEVFDSRFVYLSLTANFTNHLAACYCPLDMESICILSCHSKESIWIDYFPPTSSQLNDMWYRFQIDIICVIDTLIPLISWNFIVTVHCVFVWEKWTVFGRHLFKQIPCDLVNRYGVLWTEMIYWCHRIQVHHAMHSSSSWKWAGIRLVPNFVIWWAFTCGYNVFWFTVT